MSKVGLVGGSVVTFAGFLVLLDASAKEGKLDSVCIHDPVSGQSSCPPGTAGAISDFKAELLWGGVASLVGVGMIVVGWLTHPSDTAPPRGAATVHVGPGGIRGTF